MVTSRHRTCCSERCVVVLRATALTGVGISTLCRCPGEVQHGISVSSVTVIKDLQRGIKLAFEVPEAHLASAIAYLMGVGDMRDDFPAQIVEKLHTLVTPKGWALCVGLLKIRLEMRAQKPGDTQILDRFFKIVE